LDSLTSLSGKLLKEAQNASSQKNIMQEQLFWIRSKLQLLKYLIMVYFQYIALQ